MGDADERNLDVLESAVVVEFKGGELAGAEFGVDSDDAVNFFAGITVTFKADLRLEELDLRRELSFLSFPGWRLLLRRKEEQTSERQRSDRQGTHHKIVAGLAVRTS